MSDNNISILDLEATRQTEYIEFIEYCLHNGIHDDDELHAFIKLGFGIDIPRTRFCEHHVAPFEWLSDNFFERVEKSIGFGNRTGGKTTILSIVEFLDFIFKRRSSTTAAGSVREQAKTNYKYVKAYCNKPWFKRYIEGKPLQSYISSKHGSSLSIITASLDGFNSPHPTLSVVDEVELIEWELLQEAFSMSMSQYGIEGRDILASTRKKASGTMDKLLKEAKVRGFKIYPWCIWEVLEKCTLKTECKKCSVYYLCEGRARHCKGYYTIKDFIKKVKGLDPTTFRSQWLCLKPDTQGLFYKEFESTKHITDVDKFAKRYNINLLDVMKKFNLKEAFEIKPEHIIPDDWPRFLAFDWGFTNPTTWCAGALDKNDDILYIYKEHYMANVEAIDHAHLFIGEIPNPSKPGTYMKSEGAIKVDDEGNYIISKPYDWSEVPYVFTDADPSGAEYIACFLRKEIIPTNLANAIRGANYGIKITPAINKHEIGWPAVRERLVVMPAINSARIQFFDTCKHTIEEHENLRYPNPTERKNLSESPLPINDHTCDVVRYICARLKWMSELANVNSDDGEGDNDIMRSLSILDSGGCQLIEG